MKEKTYNSQSTLFPFVSFFLSKNRSLLSHPPTHPHTSTMSATDLPAIKADLQKALDDGCTFSSLTPIQAALDKIDAARYKTTPPDMTNIEDVDECYGGWEGRGAAGATTWPRKGSLRHIFSLHAPPPPPSSTPAPPPGVKREAGPCITCAVGGWGGRRRVRYGGGEGEALARHESLRRRLSSHLLLSSHTQTSSPAPSTPPPTSIPPSSPRSRPWRPSRKSWTAWRTPSTGIRWTS